MTIAECNSPASENMRQIISSSSAYLYAEALREADLIDLCNESFQADLSGADLRAVNSCNANLHSAIMRNESFQK